MARFTLPRDLYHGKGALEALKDFEGKKAIICVGGLSGLVASQSTGRNFPPATANKTVGR